MITLALTGSIGMGKSTVAAMFADAGIPTFDADAVVHHLQGRGGRLVPLIEERFPGTTRDGAVDREALSAVVLGDRDELAALEAIVHPAVHHERTRFIVENSDAAALLFDIPLLFETGGDEAFDKIIAFARDAYPKVWRKRVDEDLVELMKALGASPGPEVTITVKSEPNQHAQTLTGVQMTHEKRQAVWSTRNAGLIAAMAAHFRERDVPVDD